MKKDKLSFEEGVVMRSLLDLPGGLELHIGVRGREGLVSGRDPIDRSRSTDESILSILDEPCPNK